MLPFLPRQSWEALLSLAPFTGWINRVQGRKGLGWDYRADESEMPRKPRGGLFFFLILAWKLHHRSRSGSERWVGQQRLIFFMKLSLRAQGRAGSCFLGERVVGIRPSSDKAWEAHSPWSVLQKTTTASTRPSPPPSATWASP